MIQKLILENKLSSEIDAHQIQNLIAKTIKNEIEKKLEEIINSFNVPKDIHIIIPKITIDIGTIKKNEINTKLIQILISKLKQELSKTLRDKSSSNEAKKSDIFAINYFLTKGYFPWWFEIKTDFDINKII